MKSIKLILTKPALLIIAGGSLLLSCSNEKPEPNVKNTLAEEGLKGKIKSLTEITYGAMLMSGDVQKVGIAYKIVESFNKDGNLLKQKHYDTDDTLISDIANRYDSLGNKVESVSTKSIRYDAAKVGFKLKAVNSLSRTLFKYDGNGNETEESIFSQNGSLQEKIISRYNETGNKVEEGLYNNYGELKIKHIYIYDESGNNIEINRYNPDGSFDSKSTFVYDDKGRLIERVYLNSDLEAIQRYTCKYDERGQIIEELYNIMGASDKSSYEYDKYDKHGNWLYKLQTEPNMAIIEREIVYY